MNEYRIVSAYNELNNVKVLFREYLENELVKKRGVTLEFQHVDEELGNLPGRYTPATGGLFLIYCHENLAGCAAYRKISPEDCELKRLYIRDAYRGRGLGGKLLETIINKAKRKGYSQIYCDTLSTMPEAIQLYKKLGFMETEAYYKNPLDGAKYFKRKL